MVCPTAYCVYLAGNGDGPSRVRIKGTTFNYWSRFKEATYRSGDPVGDKQFKSFVEPAVQEVKKVGHWDDSSVLQTMLDRHGREVSTTAYMGRSRCPGS